MKTWRFTAGALVPETSLPLEDRSFRYGMSFFETVAIHSRRALFLEEHLARLVMAAQSVGAALDAPLLATVLHEWVPTLPDGVVRLYLTAGSGAPGDPFDGAIYVLFEECETGTMFSPLRVRSSNAVYSPLPGGWKTGNYWQNISSLAGARGNGCDEALVFNAMGALVSASMANVFLRREGRWVTPPLASGARDGVVRAWVRDVLGAAQELLSADDVAACSACFLTNSRVGIRPVSELDGRPLELDVSVRDLYLSNVLGR